MFRVGVFTYIWLVFMVHESYELDWEGYMFLVDLQQSQMTKKAQMVVE